jgi:sugar lactone lactonase YvrE
MAVLNADSSEVTILLGNGDGTFSVAASSPATGSNPNQFAVGDFNGDGIPDLAVTSDSTNTVLIYLGNGDGTFTQVPNSPAAGSDLYSIAVGDFNGDGKLDLAVTDMYDDTISILLGNGDGTFAPATTLHCGRKDSPIAVADFTGDGKLDLAVGVPGANGTGDSVTILAGNGDGTFNAPPAGTAVSSNSISSLAVGDFNGDGIPDLVLTDSAAGTFTVFLGDGKDSFTSVTTNLAGNPYFGLSSAVGDLNGDGRTDLVVGVFGSNTALVYLTEPTETATATANISLASAGQHLLDASYGGDGNYKSSVSGTTPLWGAPPATTTTLTVTSGGTPVTTVAPGSVVTLNATVTAGTSPVTAGQVSFCDASTTECTDIHLLGTVALSSSGSAAFKFVPGPGVHSYRAAFVQNGYGLTSFSGPSALTVGPAPSVVYTDSTAISVGGFPGNYSLTATVVGFGGSASPTGSVSFLDTSFGNASLASVPLGSSTAGLGWLISQTPAFSNIPFSEVTGDFNGDGIPDLAVLWSTSTYGGPYSVTILFGKGDGTFTTGPTVQPAGVQSYPTMIGGDFNGDGKTDLAVLSWNGYSISYITTLLGNGDGTFTTSQTGQVFNQGSVGGDGILGHMVAADFNGDGKLDLAVVGDYVSAGGVTILLGNGDGTFKAAGPNLEPSQGFGLIASGDFNGDGIPDLVALQYFEPGGATVFLGNGDGTFTATATLPSVDSFPKSIVVGDFAADGKSDLAIGYTGAVAVYLGNGDGTFNAASGSPVSGAGLSLQMGDFNHDGKLDLAGIDNYNNQIDLFVGAGDGTFKETTTIPTVSQSLLGPFAILAADFNGDGIPDLAMLTSNVGTASILLAEPTQTATATVNGLAPVGAGTHNVEASYPGDSNYPSSVSATASLTAGVATPVFSVGSGTYSSAQTVTITETTPGATIYYMASGFTQTSGFVQYTAPIPVSGSGSETIQAYAVETGYQQSANVSATYVMNLAPALTPTISAPSGTYPGPQPVTISDSTPGAIIYYTTNGTTPTPSSAQYTGPITVSTSGTLVAIAFAYGYSASAPASAQYLIASSSSSFIYRVAGDGSSGYSGDGGPATAADLNYPYETALDSAGNLYIADSNNNVVRKVAAGTGIITTVAGSGTAGYSGDNGAATSAQLYAPFSVALDGAGNLYISDNGNSVVRKVTAATGVITTFAGNGTSGSSGDNGPATSAALEYPRGIALDGTGNLYIADSISQRIRKVAAGTGIITTVAGNGTAGYSGDGGPATSASLRSPVGIATDSAGNLYLADEFNNVIRKVTASNGVISTVAGNENASYSYQGGYSGDGGPATSAQLYWPSAVSVDGAGNLYIADYTNQVIRKVNASSGIITTVAGNGSMCGSPSGDSGPATSAALCYPEGVSVDGAGNLYISDTYSGRIREVTVSALPPSAPTPAPVFNVPAGTYAGPQTVTVTDPAPGAAIYITMDGTVPSTLSAGYNGPIDLSGSVTIQVIAVAPGYLPSAPVTAAYTITSAPVAVISTVAGNGVDGYSGFGGPAVSAELGYTHSLALDAAGDLYFSDTTNNVVWMLTAKTGDISVVAGTGTPGYSGDGGPATNALFYSPAGMAIDSAGDLYIADSGNNVIRKLTASTGLITTVAGNGHAGGNLAASNGVPATSTGLSQPQGVALDSAGNLYIADTGAGVVRMVSASSGIITIVAGNGSYGFSGDGGPATSAGLNEPNALAIDSAGNLYIATYNAGRIRKVEASTGVITTVAGNGDVFGGTGDGGLAVNAEIYPQGLALDSAGNLYISNWPGAVREVVASTGVITTVAGNGYLSYSGDGGSATVAGIAYPQGIAFDAANNLYISDRGNFRIRKVAFTGLPATPVISVASGTYNAAQTVQISDITPGTAIYYTTDGTTPTGASAVYTGPITVSASETLQAVAVDTGNATSGVATAAYIIKLPLTPTITWPTPAAITYGTALSATQLDATASVDGTFVYTPAASTVLAAGSQTLSVTFTPTDTADYAAVTTTVKLVVNQAASTVTWTAPAAFTYGTALSATQLDATASVAGTFAYTPAAGTVLPAGSQTLSVTFTPTDSTDYTTVTTTVKLTVNQAASTVAWATPTAIVYGTALSATQLDATASVAGTFAYTPAAGTVLPLGSQTLSVTFTPTDATDYTAATATVKLAVNQAASTIAWATPAAITYGTALSAKQLDATASVAGTFAYTPAAGTVLLAGSQTLSVTFAPTDSTDYTPATATVTLVVNKATPAVTETPSASSITTAQTLTVTVDVNAASGSPVPTGSVTLSSGSYSAQQTLAKGAAAFSVAAGALATGSDTLAVTYTPDASSAGMYSTATQSATVTVSVPIGTTTPAVTVTPSAATITDQQSDTVSVSVAGASGQATPSGTLTLASGSYSAQQTLINGSASFAIKAGALTSGANTLTATYSGDANYASTTGTATVTVSPVVVAVPPPPQVSPGASATATATLSAGSTYSGTLNLSCTLTASPTGAQSLPTCSLNPATITITSGGSGTSVLTVNTTAASTTALARPAGSNLWGIGGGGAVLAALLMFGIPSRRRRWLPMLALLWVIAAGGIMACGGGGGSSSSSITTHSTPATTSGSYTFTVAGADSANAKIAASTNVTITVQ